MKQTIINRLDMLAGKCCTRPVRRVRIETLERRAVKHKGVKLHPASAPGED